MSFALLTATASAVAGGVGAAVAGIGAGVSAVGAGVSAVGGAIGGVGAGAAGASGAAGAAGATGAGVAGAGGAGAAGAAGAGAAGALGAGAAGAGAAAGGGSGGLLTAGAVGGAGGGLLAAGSGGGAAAESGAIAGSQAVAGVANAGKVIAEKGVAAGKEATGIAAKAKEVVNKPFAAADNVIKEGLTKMGYDMADPKTLKIYENIKDKAKKMPLDMANSLIEKAGQSAQQQDDYTQQQGGGSVENEKTQKSGSIDSLIDAALGVKGGKAGKPEDSGSLLDSIVQGASGAGLNNVVSEQGVGRSALSSTTGAGVSESLKQQVGEESALGGVMVEDKKDTSIIDSYVAREEADNSPESKKHKFGRYATQVGLEGASMGANLIESASGLNIGLGKVIGEGAEGLRGMHKAGIEQEQNQERLAGFFGRNKKNIDSLLAKDLISQVDEGISFDDAIKSVKAGRDFVYGEEKAGPEQEKLEAQRDESVIGARVATATENAKIFKETGGVLKGEGESQQDYFNKLSASKIDQSRKEAMAATLGKGAATSFIKQQEANAEKDANFGRVVQGFKNLVGQLRLKGEEQGGLGLWEGLVGNLSVMARRPEFAGTKAFKGARKELQLSFNNILTGQNRVIKGVVEMIGETIPDDYDPESFSAQEIAQSIGQAYRIKKAFKESGYSPEVLEAMSQGALDSINVKSLVEKTTLTPEENAELESIIDDVLSTPKAKTRMFGNKTGANSGETKSGVKFSYKKVG